MTWRTSTVMRLCESMRETNNYDAAPVLADALEEAGFPDHEILEQMRTSVDRWERKHTVRQKLVAIVYSNESAEAVADIENFAYFLDQTYSRLMQAAWNWVSSGDYTRDDTESYKEATQKQWKKFWDNWELVTGQKARNGKYDRGSFFTCSC